MSEQVREHIVSMDCWCHPLVVMDHAPIQMPHSGTIVQQDLVIGEHGVGYAVHVEPKED